MPPRATKRILAEDDATSKLDSGIEQVADTVGMTMGPKGRNVALMLDGIGEGKVILTKDGVLVANHCIPLPDPEENMGAVLAVEASRKTNDSAGDGTTATVVLLHAMLKEARKRVKVGSNPIHIQQGMQREKELVVSFLEDIQTPIENEEELYNVALVSCQDEGIARKIADILQEIGKYGTVSVESQTGPLTIDLRVQRGMHFDIGYEARLTQMSSAAVMGQLQKKGSALKISWENDQVGVLIFDEPVRQWSDVDHIFSACVAADRKKLLIIGDFHDDAAVGLQTQMQRQIFSAVTITRSQFGGDVGRETLKDIAVFCGARMMSPGEGTLPGRNKNITDINAILGSCTASVGMESFSLTAGLGTQEDVQARVALINTLIEQGGLNDFGKQKYRERIARFQAGIGTITIFAPTDIQQQSIRTRVDDAVCAVRSANEEGIVPGGGVALVRCHQWLKQGEQLEENEDITAGREIVREALLQPASKISEMAGEQAGVRLAQIMKHDWKSPIGYDYWTEKECDLIECGILDPKKVVRLCVENAVSVVGEVLRVGRTISDVQQGEDDPYLSPRERALAGHAARVRNG